jgi:hypothetical protein
MNNTPVQVFLTSGLAVNLLTGDSVTLSEEECSRYRNDVMFRSEVNSALATPVPTGSQDPDYLTFTIETTRVCNLACTYCYQNDRKTKERISYDLIDKIVDYILWACRDSGKRYAEIRLIGGEPLIARPETEYLVEALESADDCTFSYYADTNGCLPLSWLFEAAERVSVCVCLTLPRDHNKERYSSGHDTTERIIRNISRVSPNATQEVALCYNAHHNNLGDFEDYLEWIAPLQNNPVGQVFASNLDNYTFNELRFFNSLTSAEFDYWYGNVAVPLLLKYGWPVTFQEALPSCLCQGHQPYSCKFYASGEVTICDAMQIHESRCDVSKLASDPGMLNRVYADIKTHDPWVSTGCSSCFARPVCGGRKWCEIGECRPSACSRHMAANLKVMEFHFGSDAS